MFDSLNEIQRRADESRARSEARRNRDDRLLPRTAREWRTVLVILMALTAVAYVATAAFPDLR